MKQTAEEMLDEIQVHLETINQKLEEKVHLKEESKRKNSHLHIFLETSLMNKLRKEAEEKGVGISELCRQKLRFNEKEDVILNVLRNIVNRLERVESSLNSLLKGK